MSSLDASSFEECLGEEFNLSSDLEMDWLLGESADADEQNQAVHAQDAENLCLSSYLRSTSSRKASSTYSYRKRRLVKGLDYIPRVVKHDIRRFYARMLVNVWNSHDPYLFQSLLRTYAVRNVKSFQTGTFSPFRLPGGEANKFYSVGDVAFHGANLFAKWMGFVQQLVPDQTMSLSDVKIVSSSASDCSVVKFRVRNYITNVFSFQSQESSELMENMVFYDCKLVGNNLIDYDCLTQGDDLPVESRGVVKKVFEPVKTASSGFYVPDISNTYQHLYGKRPNMVKSLRSFSSDVEVTLHINEQREIEEVHFARVI